MKKYNNYFFSLAILWMVCIGICKTGSIKAQSYNIKNDVFWNTKDGQPIYSQGGGIFRFGDTKTGEKNTTGMVCIILRLKNIVMINQLCTRTAPLNL